jgi:hypothetical protein
MFLPNTSFRFAAMQRNETALQGIANLNGGSDITNTIAAIGTNLNRVYLFQNIFGQFGNGIITTHITNTNIDTLSQKTSIYNYVRTINNNAF